MVEQPIIDIARNQQLPELLPEPKAKRGADTRQCAAVEPVPATRASGAHTMVDVRCTLRAVMAWHRVPFCARHAPKRRAGQPGWERL